MIIPWSCLFKGGAKVCHLRSGNLWPIQLISSRLHFLVCTARSQWRRLIQWLWETPLVAQGSISCCYRCCCIMITRDSSLVTFLSADESEEHNTCHVSIDCLLTFKCFCFKIIMWHLCGYLSLRKRLGWWCLCFVVYRFYVLFFVADVFCSHAAAVWPLSITTSFLFPVQSIKH